MNRTDIRLDKIVDEEAKASKESGTGYVHRKVVVAAVERRLVEEGLPIEARGEMLHRVAEYETDRYFNLRKPKITNQESIYCPDFWLPLGDGKRVQMCDAGTADLITYLRGVRKNEERVKARALTTGEYIDVRVAALEANPGQRLHWVEVNLFGYVMADEPEDFGWDTEEDTL